MAEAPASSSRFALSRSRDSGEEDGTQARPWNSFAEANAHAGNGATIVVLGGDYDEGPELITKRVGIEASDGEVLLH